MKQALLIQSCMKNVICGTTNGVFTDSTDLFSFQRGRNQDTPFCFLLEIPHHCGSPGYLYSCLTPFSIQCSLLFSAFSPHLDKYSTVELSQLETVGFSHFSHFVVHSSICQVLLVYFRVKSSKRHLHSFLCKDLSW